MSLKTLPLLFLNMGGEMMYILDQRLRAQTVRKDKSAKVLSDIGATMFNVRFINELYKAQDPYSRRALRALFDKLAHASIMRLNESSMDKLYDLMVMAVKYQVQACSSPKETLLVTMNHFDGIRKLCQGAANVQAQIDHAYDLFMHTYEPMNLCELQLIRETLLHFFQDSRVKISILLREKKQLQDGRFVVPANTTVGYGACAPGTIRYFAKGKAGKTITFPAGNTYTEPRKEGSLQKSVKAAERGTDLGTNMYKDHVADTQGGTGSSAGISGPTQDTLAKEELNLLRHLVGTSDGNSTNFSLSLFDNDDEEKHFVKQARRNSEKVIKIDASKNRRESLDREMSSMSVKERRASSASRRKAKGEDLLSMMDSAK